MDELFEELLRTHTEFRRFHREHQQFEEQLQRMNSIRKLTSADEIERKNLQKMKLQKKDAMERILASASRDRKRVAQSGA